MPLSRTIVAGLVALASLLVLSAPAAAQNTKPYAMAVAPPSVPGSQTTQMTATLTNHAPNQTLGSANVTPPPGFVVAPAPISTTRGTVSVSSNVVQVRNLSLPSDASVTITMQVRAPGCGGGDWDVLAKQANNFSGPPGNNLTLDAPASQLNTRVVGACGLRFSAQPAHALVNTAITSTAFDPTGPAVQVQVLGADGQPAAVAGVPVTVALGSISSGLGALTPASTTATTDSQGAASFGPLGIDAIGTYTLEATAAGHSATSSPFSIEEVATRCDTGSDCSATNARPHTRVDVTAGANATAGYLTLSFQGRPTLSCDAPGIGYRQFTSDVAIVDGPARAKTITLRISKETFLQDTSRGIAHVQICFGYPVPFPVRPGTQLLDDFAFDFDRNGIVEPGYRGLLPDCGETIEHHCVSARRKDNAGNGIVTVRAPANALDPPYRG